jgi:hypothetical protein
MRLWLPSGLHMFLCNCAKLFPAALSTGWEGRTGRVSDASKLLRIITLRTISVVALEFGSWPAVCTNDPVCFPLSDLNLLCDPRFVDWS